MIAEAVHAHVEGDEDVLLALEVVVDRGLRETELGGDLAKRCLGVPLAGEQVERDVEDALASCRRLVRFRLAWRGGERSGGRP